MATNPGTVLITGVSGNLGQRLLLQLKDFNVVGVDMFAPTDASSLSRFEQLDVGEESSCDRLVELLKETSPEAVIHLAFVIDPVRNGVTELRRMWQINVAGTARVMEAIAEVNRHSGGRVRKFIFPSSVSAYGSDLPPLVNESHPLEGHTLPYAFHKKESDELVQLRAEDLGDCRTYILRPHIFAGASMQNYLIGALRGTPSGGGKLAGALRRRGTRLPMILPFGNRYLKRKLQFVHVDDVARLMAWLLRQGPAGAGVTVLNVAGRGDALPAEECFRIANAKCMRLPGKYACKFVLQMLWALGISGVPPEALPYIVGSYTMDTRRLQQLLGKDFEVVMKHTVRSALADSFASNASAMAAR